MYVTVTYITFLPISHVIYMEKMKSDKQRGEHVYPVLEMLNNTIKGLKLKKIKFENLEKKIRKIRHLPVNHPRVNASNS